MSEAYETTPLPVGETLQSVVPQLAAAKKRNRNDLRRLFAGSFYAGRTLARQKQHPCLNQSPSAQLRVPALLCTERASGDPLYGVPTYSVFTASGTVLLHWL